MIPSFHRAAATYESSASLQRSLVHALAATINSPAAQRVLDAGCGTGFFSEWAKQHRPEWNVVGLDAAYGMCQHAKRHGPIIQGKMERMPIANASLDGVFCASSLQWVEDWQAPFQQWFQMLRQGGWLAVSVFVEGTLAELQHAFESVDDYSHLLAFKSHDAAMNMAKKAGFRIEKNEFHHHPQRVETLIALMKQLKQIGATGKSGQPRKGLMTPRQLRQLEVAYPSPANDAGGLMVSWSVATLIARKDAS